MQVPGICPDPAVVTSEWLTAVMHRNDHDANVDSFHYDQIGTGQMARCYRFSLKLDGDQSAPRTMVGKFNSADPETRERAALGGAYRSELMFYRELAADLPMATPHCYYAEIDEEGRNFTLLLEDMSPAVQGDQMEGCTLAAAEKAVDELASLHSATWNNQALQHSAWLPAGRGHLHMSRDGLKECAPEFIRRLGNQLEPEVLELVDKLGKNFGNLIPLIEKHPGAVAHNDYRADNLLIDDSLQPPVVTAVDWQTLSFGAPLPDVAYFIGASLTTELRRKNEMRLLERYYQKICANGVVDFSWEDCLDGYRSGSFSGLTMAVNAFVFVEETERGTEMFMTMARRHAKQILDLQADKLLA